MHRTSTVGTRHLARILPAAAIAVSLVVPGVALAATQCDYNAWYPVCQQENTCTAWTYCYYSTCPTAT